MRYRLNLPRLAELLAGSRVSQNHWALKLGLSRGHWSDIVNGRHPYPSEKTRVRMLEVFAVPDLFIAEPAQRGADVDFRIAISGRYELTGEIGHGGMGAVYLANDLALGRLVALKVVSAEAASGVGVDQLMKEIAVVARLQHPNILPLFDAGTGAGSPYYVMPYVRSGSLGARLRNAGRLPLAEVVGLVREISAGLAHAHEHRVLHCDIKPENILIDGAHPYLMDFGIARTLHTEANEWIGIRKELDFSAGTPAYVSPEQAAGDRDIDQRSDVYSLACVAYEMLTGRVAFSGENTQEIVSLRFREPPPPLQEFAPEVPAVVSQVITQAMSLDPGRRPQTAMEFADALATGVDATSAMGTRVSFAITKAQRWVHARTGNPHRAVRAGAFGMMISSIQRDIAFAFRQASRTPLLSAMAVLTLALGIGLTTTVFALVDGVLLRPLPYPNQERLVALESVDSAGNHISRVSAANWNDWKNKNTTLTAAAVYAPDRISVVARGKAMRVMSGWVSPEFFDAVGARFLFGRAFDSAEVARGSLGAIVTEEFWRANLGAARDSLQISVNGYRMPVIGVLAHGQAYPADAEVWTPFQYRHAGGRARNNINFLAIGRLKPHVTVDSAERDLTSIAKGINVSDPGSLYSYGVHVVSVRDQLVGDTRSLLALLSGGAGAVLLIACANLASANLAQGAKRQREMAVRAALGAGRERLIRQVLIENIVTAFVGAALGVGIAWVALRTTVITQGAELPRITEITINPVVIGIAVAAALVSGIATGLLPALQASRTSPNDVLGGSARGTVFGGRGLAGRALVTVEIALALMLVTGAGLFTRSFRAVVAQPLGFETAHVSYAQIALGGPVYQRDTSQVQQYWTRLADALRAQPGIRAVGIAGFVPLVRGGTGFIEVEGRVDPGAGAGYRIVSEGYFDALGMKRLDGREFNSGDHAGSERVALVNQTMAHRYWPNESPIGKRVRAVSMEPATNGQPPEWISVIGVVNDVRHFGYEFEPGPEMFVLYRQLPAWRLSALSVIARGEGTNAVLETTMRRAIERADPNVPADISSLDAAARSTTAARRFMMQVLDLFSGLSLVLAAAGIFGVLAFSVAQRTREIAVRSALGAQRPQLVTLVLGNAAAVVGSGIAIGMVGVYVLGRVVESMLFGVRPNDPSTLVIAGIAIAIVGALAAAIPARRAVRIDPMVVLRNDG